ncbi:MAG: nitrous oxide reductase accessory protein NosL [Nitrospirae bacterium]|nr:nitrous oxide reductase accessory protein NosL [Nitrospirota bacterium]MBF0536453.1 nitrous oxide reductase accessory protein NosL [Nitrospirota bacterium]MBF0618399.1 nitrous oxide reductase accessory protein NosL [Nitrospirota bacterium]
MLYVAVFILILGITTLVWAHDPKKPGANDKCAVCGMLVKAFPKWAAQIVFKDGTYVYFDGPKDMFKFYFDVAKYNKHKTQADISDIYVTEYYSAKTVKADSVVFVIGSNVEGPMGTEVVPVPESKVKGFMLDHKGDKALKFSEITVSDIPGAEMSGHKGMHDGNMK